MYTFKCFNIYFNFLILKLKNTLCYAYILILFRHGRIVRNQINVFKMQVLLIINIFISFTESDFGNRQSNIYKIIYKANEFINKYK